MDILRVEQVSFAKEYYHSHAIDVEPIPGAVVDGDEPPPRHLVCRIWLVQPGITILAGGKQRQTGGLRTLTVVKKSAQETFMIYVHVHNQMCDQGQIIDIALSDRLWSEIQETYGLVAEPSGGNNGS